jgi:16S rRNA processing protein RimM
VDQSWICVGKVGAVSGVHGFLKLWSYTEPEDNILSYENLYFKSAEGYEPIDISEIKGRIGRILIQFGGIEDRDEAKQFTGKEIFIPKEDLLELEDGDYYWSELEGMRVFNLQGYDMGKVDHLLETGSNDVLVVKANINDAFGKKERLVPYIPEQVVIDIDRESGLIKVDWAPDF